MKVIQKQQPGHEISTNSSAAVPRRSASSSAPIAHDNNFCMFRSSPPNTYPHARSAARRTRRTVPEFWKHDKKRFRILVFCRIQVGPVFGQKSIAVTKGTERWKQSYSCRIPGRVEILCLRTLCGKFPPFSNLPLQDVSDVSRVNFRHIFQLSVDIMEQECQSRS